MKIFKAYIYSIGAYASGSYRGTSRSGRTWSKYHHVKAAMKQGCLRFYHPDDIEIRCWEIGDNEFKALTNDEPPEIA